jgi:hypothetical protein
MDNDWKPKLRYGRLKTTYKHYTLIAPVLIEQYIEDFDVDAGTAYIGAKIWATHSNEATDMLLRIGSQTGYKITGNIEIYETDPKQPPGDYPEAYSINFSYYNGR